MKKSLLSALGLAVALAFSMPVLGVSSANAAATTTTTAAAPAKPPVKKASAKKTCKPTETHKCPVTHTAKKTAPKA